MDSIIAQLEGAGLIIDRAPEIGRLVRCKVDGDAGQKKSGWYVLHDFPLRKGGSVVTGSYGNWKRYGDESLKIKFDLPPLSEEEKREFAQRQAAQRAQAEQEKNERAADAARRAERIFSKLPEVGASAYLKRKKVGAYGLRFSRGSIVVPVRNIAGDLVGLQFIDADGGKKFLTGTPKRGCFHVVGDDFLYDVTDAAPIAIAEGYATAASIYQATGWQVVVAFDAGNLLPVAQAWRQKFTARKFVICADNDAQTEGNPGVTKATEAARAIGALLWVPDFAVVKPRAA